MSSAAVESTEAPITSDSLSIELIRRWLSGETLGRHMYLFGRAASTVEILRRLADAGAREGTVVLSEDGIDMHLSVLFRPGRPLQAMGALAGLAAQALAEAIRLERLPEASTVECTATAHRTEWLMIGVGTRFGEVSGTAVHKIDRNAFAATFLNRLDRSFTAWRAGGRGTVVAGRSEGGGVHARQ